jgi:hypothetical protein
MKDETRDRIVDDLLTRKPKGEKCQKPTYEVVEYYCYDAHKYKSRVESDHAGWGYTDSSLWDLGFREEDDVKTYLFNRFYKDPDMCWKVYHLTQGKKAGLTRKTNRLWSRISNSLRKTQREGDLPGLYRVGVGWENTFFFYGESVAEIKTMAETMLRPIYPEDSLDVRFVDRSVPGDILDRNISAFKNIERKVKNLKEKAKKCTEEANLAESKAEFVKTLITQNLEIAMRVS